VKPSERRVQPTVELLTRSGCSLCDKAASVLTGLLDEFGFAFSTTDVDVAAAQGNPGLRAEYGDLLPVVLLDGVQHSYWEVDEPGLRADLAARRAGA
jgi:hypothetical protein